MAEQAYPGTVTPLRGLAAFTESERDVLFGRDGEREELAKLITSDSFRAGLLHGEPGVGKTSLLRAGLIPHLRDHGVIALPCDDLSNPAASFAATAAAQTGLNATEGERPINYLARIVSQAIAGQQYLFILDDVDIILARGDENVITQLGDLFARVVTRSGGRARFLFACCSSRVHRFGVLERRTGSLFPPSSRFELRRFDPPTAAHVLERTIELAGLGADRTVAHAVAEELGQMGPILPADLQIATMAIGELRIQTVDQLRACGGAIDLERQWLTRIAASTGNERAGLRLLAELATGDGTIPYAPDWAATRAGLGREFAHRAMGVLQGRGLVYPIGSLDGQNTHFMLAHEILAPRIREIAAPARASARRAYELLGSKAAQGKRLSAMEWFALWREGIVPSTPDDRAVLARTKRFFQIVGGIAVGVPLLILIIIWISLAGSYYLDTAKSADGRTDRVVVRKGKAGLSAFHWLPASPGYGEIVADTGITRAMIAPNRWEAIADNDLSGDLDGDGYADDVLAALAPDERAILDYAATGDGVHLQRFLTGEPTVDQKVAVLEALRPIARGGTEEVLLVETRLDDSSPAVQAAALGVAATGAKRHPTSYRDVLARALTASNQGLRHLAFSAARSLGEESSASIFQIALASDPEPAARAELLAAVTTNVGDEIDPEAAASILASQEVSPQNRKRAERLLRRAFATAPADAARASETLVSDHEAPKEHRLLAMELIDQYAPKETYPDLAGPFKLAVRSKDEEIKIAAWPLFARMNPKDAAVELVGLTEKLDSLSEEMRIAVASGWGELARTEEPAAGPSLEPMLDDRDPDVRAAAARAFGFVGRSSQRELVEMVKKERFDVAVGAAWGLANSDEVGASTGVAVGGIRQLWKRKGRSRRAAAEIYAKMARHSPRAVYSYLSSAARGKDDADLKPIGARGLCNALGAGYGSAIRGLSRAARDSSTDVRRIVADCMVANMDKPKVVDDIAGILANDSDATIRADAARVLAKVAAASGGKSGAKQLVALVGDDDRAVRVLAVNGLASLGPDAPDTSGKALMRAFESADEGEKLELLDAARLIGAAELVPMALSDDAASVRVAGLDAAIGAGADAAAAVNTALGDVDPVVRRAALEAIASGESGLGASAVDGALSMAMRDRDPTIAAFAMETYARLGDPGEVKKRLIRELAAPSEHVRARAASACAGLSSKDAVELLEPVLGDPARDVRVAMLPPLASAYADTKGVDELAALLKRSENHSTRRYVAAAALFIADGGNGASNKALEGVAKGGPALAAHAARLTLGLIEGNTDGVAFLAERLR